MAEIIARADAKARGLKRYFLGKPCASGNIAERLVSSAQCMCPDCQRAMRQRRDPEKRSAIMRSWRERNREHRKTYKRAYRAADPEKARAQDLAWREKNRERRAQESADYRRANPGKSRAAVARWRAAVHQATPSWADLADIAAIYDEASRLSDEQGRVYHVDHIVPLRGVNVCGLHVPWNLRVVTATENCAKSNRLIEAA
jgi:hypothetical protein